MSQHAVIKVDTTTDPANPTVDTVGDDGMINNIVNTLSAAISGDDQTYVRSSYALLTSVATAAAGGAVGSTVARKRQSEGKDPVLRFFG